MTLNIYDPLSLATHLKAKKGTINEKLRYQQTLELRQHAEQTANQLIEQGWNTSIVIAGDFNSEPDEAAINCILSDNEELCYNTKARTFQSAYPLSEDGNTLYTTWKTRKDGTTRRVIDYIFYGGHGLECTHYLSVPEDDEVEEDRLPGFRYPSDHLLIGAAFNC